MVTKTIQGYKVTILKHSSHYDIFIDGAFRTTCYDINTGFQIAKEWIEDNLM